MQQDPRIGTVLVGHRIDALLGRGGMGYVYKAEHLTLRRKVALKVLAPELGRNEEYRGRFLLESQMAARLEHPNIVPVYEAGEAEGVLYIAMRFIDGEDLDAILVREGRLVPERAVALLGQIAAALDAAHAHGLVHRDVKPANVLVSRTAPGAPEHAWLCDFGLVKPFDTPTLQRLTATGMFMGTIQYTSPEQIEARRLDGRADVYALGCVLYECLTGVLPFERENDPQTLYAHVHDPPPPVGQVLPGLPASLDAVFAKALAKQRNDRYGTCSELIRAAAQALASAPQRPVYQQQQPPPAAVQAGYGQAQQWPQAPSAAAAQQTPAHYGYGQLGGVQPGRAARHADKGGRRTGLIVAAVVVAALVIGGVALAATLVSNLYGG